MNRSIRDDQRRIATQRISGIDERRRIIATIVEPPIYFADSTNSITRNDDIAFHDLRYLLGLLNSELFQWRFRITSTNNNVGTNELESMPFRAIDPQDEMDAKTYERIVDIVQELMTASIAEEELAGCQTTMTQDQFDSADQEIDELVYRLYGLTDNDVRVIQGAFES